MPHLPDGASWSVQTDLSRVDAVLSSLISLSSQAPSPGLSEIFFRNILFPYSYLLSFVRTAYIHRFLYFQLRIRSAQLIKTLKEKFHADRAMRETEARLLSLQKITTIDHMSSMIAHELPQPLGAILAYSEGLLRLQKTGPVDDELLTEMLIKIVFKRARPKK